MATEVLRPQDCLIDRMRIPVSPVIVFPQRNLARNGVSGRKPAATARSEPRKRLPEPRKAVEEVAKPSAKKLVQVTILKRGEAMPEKRIREVGEKKLAVPEMERQGPHPAMVPTYPSNVYAGTAFFHSPEPSDLPLPKFSKKKAGLGLVDDSATKDLRRLLRLE